MQQQIVFCDYDSFLNNLDQAWLLWIEETYGRKYTTADILHWHWLEDQCGPAVNDFWKTPGNYSRIFPKPGAQEFVQILRDNFGEQNVRIVTSSPPGMDKEKDLHIQKHFGINPNDIVHASEKWPHTTGGVLLDDNKDHILNHVAKNNRLGIIFDENGLYGWSKLALDDVVHPDLLKVAHSYEHILQYLGINSK